MADTWNNTDIVYVWLTRAQWVNGNKTNSRRYSVAMSIHVCSFAADKTMVGFSFSILYVFFIHTCVLYILHIYISIVCINYAYFGTFGYCFCVGNMSSVPSTHWECSAVRRLRLVHTCKMLLIIWFSIYICILFKRWKNGVKTINCVMLMLAQNTQIHCTGWYRYITAIVVDQSVINVYFAQTHKISTRFSNRVWHR